MEALQGMISQGGQDCMVLKEMVVSLVMTHTTSGCTYLDVEEVSEVVSTTGLFMKEMLNNLHEINHESIYTKSKKPYYLQLKFILSYYWKSVLRQMKLGAKCVDAQNKLTHCLPFSYSLVCKYPDMNPPTFKSTKTNKTVSNKYLSDS